MATSFDYPTQLTRTEIVEIWFNQNWPMERIGQKTLLDFYDFHFAGYVDDTDNRVFPEWLDITEDGLGAVCAMINGHAYGSIVANEYDTPDSDRLEGTTRQDAIDGWKAVFFG